MARIIPATADHALCVARDMRQADIDECRAASGHSPGVACVRSWSESTHCWAAVDDDGVPFTIFGVGPVLDDLGSPWLLASSRMYAHRSFFARNTRPIVALMHAAYPILLNYVDARHNEAIRWLMWAGFKFDKLIPNFGVEQRHFFRFTKV